MNHLKILSKKEYKKILVELEGHFGEFKLPEYAFIKNNDYKVYLLSRKFSELDQSKVRINNLGLYFGTLEVDGFRLSIEGAQLVDPKRNFIEVDKQQAFSWMRGNDIPVGDVDAKGYVILKFGKDILGCGKLKDGKVLNMIPKARRIIGEMADDEGEHLRTIKNRRAR